MSSAITISLVYALLPLWFLRLDRLVIIVYFCLLDFKNLVVVDEDCYQECQRADVWIGTVGQSCIVPEVWGTRNSQTVLSLPQQYNFEAMSLTKASVNCNTKCKKFTLLNV